MTVPGQAAEGWFLCGHCRSALPHRRQSSICKANELVAAALAGAQSYPSRPNYYSEWPSSDSDGESHGKIKLTHYPIAPRASIGDTVDYEDLIMEQQEDDGRNV